MDDLGVNSWAKLSHGHDFMIMRAKGSLCFTLMADGWHKCTIMWRDDLDYSEEIIEDLLETLNTDD